MGKEKKKESKAEGDKAGSNLNLYATLAIVLVAVLYLQMGPSEKADSGLMDAFAEVQKSEPAKAKKTKAKKSSGKVDQAKAKAKAAAERPPMQAEFTNPTDEEITLAAEVNHKLVEIGTISAGGAMTVDTFAGDKLCFSTHPSKLKCAHVVIADPEQRSYAFKANCKNRHDQCGTFAKQGSCENNPGWMTVYCPVSCHRCHLLDSKVRCDKARMGMDPEGAIAPGRIDEMFSGLAEKHPELGVTVLSESPWVVTFDNLMDEDEMNDILKHTGNQLKRSTDQGDIDSETGEQAQTVSSSRTSTNAWCVGECYEQRGTQHLLAKIERILGVPKENFENFQVLNYKVGQFYQTHHDANPANLAMASGHRVYTMFLYFSDVEEGGETDFPKLNISVTPKKGKALLWPSVLSDDPSAIDYRTMHQAKPVLKGTKIAANAWVHTHNYQVPNLWGCTGSFDT